AYFTPFDVDLLLAGPAADESTPVDIEIEYRTPAPAGEKRVLHSGPMRWIVGPDAGDGPGEVHASAALGRWPG
ncbi:MAG: hypothetical protein ACRDK8_16085, partial [Solirubrobacteraceae bacterium]